MSIFQFTNGALKRISGNTKGDAALDANSHNNVENAAVTNAINQINSDLGDKSSASSVTGDDAFTKINTLKSALPENVASIFSLVSNTDTINSLSAQKINNNIIVTFDVVLNIVSGGKEFLKITTSNSIKPSITAGIGFDSSDVARPIRITVASNKRVVFSGLGTSTKEVCGTIMFETY